MYNRQTGAQMHCTNVSFTLAIFLLFELRFQRRFRGDLVAILLRHSSQTLKSSNFVPGLKFEELVLRRHSFSAHTLGNLRCDDYGLRLRSNFYTGSGSCLLGFDFWYRINKLWRPSNTWRIRTQHFNALFHPGYSPSLFDGEYPNYTSIKLFWLYVSNVKLFTHCITLVIRIYFLM